MAEFTVEVNAQRTYLMRVAMLQLREREQAEDVVQETLLAAIEGEDKFAGKSSVKTWLIGILRHKIVDAIRKKTREPSTPMPGAEDEIDDLDAFFNELMRFTKELNGEEERGLRESLTEEELAIFDIRTRPEPKLSDNEAAEVKRSRRIC